MRNTKSITFFYPSKIVGGAEYLFMRLAAVLSQQSDLQIYYVDYADGFAKMSLKEEGMKVNFIEFSSYNKIKLYSETIIVTPFSSIVDILTYIEDDPTIKILFWSIHPLGLKNIISNYLRYSPFKYGKDVFKKYKDSINFILRKKGICFMDRPNLLIQKEIFDFENESIDFVPIPCEFSVLKNEGRKGKEGREINIGWVGRLSEEKVYALLNVLDHCKMIANNDLVINFHIIGEGEKASMINVCDYHTGLNPILLGSLTGKDLKEYLVNKVDILFAMGTSALEGASLFLPTILVDFSYVPIPATNRFRWLYESVDFSLGDQYNGTNNYNHTFSDIIRDMLSDKYELYCSKSYEYFKKNHSLLEVLKMFEKALENTTLTITSLGDTKFNTFSRVGALRRIKNYLNYLCRNY